MSVHLWIKSRECIVLFPFAIKKCSVLVINPEPWQAIAKDKKGFNNGIIDFHNSIEETFNITIQPITWTILKKNLYQVSKIGVLSLLYN